MEFFRVFLKNPIYEKLSCYTVNQEEAKSIEPDSLSFFSGEPEEAMVLAASEYYVTQIQTDSLNNDELLNAAIELQKEALWNRLKPENKLYLRTFTENPSEKNSSITQLWRPVVPGSL